MAVVATAAGQRAVKPSRLSTRLAYAPTGAGGKPQGGQTTIGSALPAKPTRRWRERRRAGASARHGEAVRQKAAAGQAGCSTGEGKAVMAGGARVAAIHPAAMLLGSWGRGEVAEAMLRGGW